jgi:hypothetical protein
MPAFCMAILADIQSPVFKSAQAFPRISINLGRSLGRCPRALASSSHQATTYRQSGDPMNFWSRHLMSVLFFAPKGIEPSTLQLAFLLSDAKYRKIKDFCYFCSISSPDDARLSGSGADERSAIIFVHALLRFNRVVSADPSLSTCETLSGRSVIPVSPSGS